MKVAYFGLPLGALLLQLDGHRLGPIVLSPIDAPGRRRLCRRSAVIDALDGMPDLGSRIAQSLEQQAPELLVSWFWTRKLPDEWLRLPRLGAIGVHPSLLPRHRGPNPYFWAIDSGDPLTGVTLHRLAADYDTGAILTSRTLPVDDRNAWQLARALDRPSLALLRDGVQRLARGEQLVETAQDEAAASWAPEPSGDALRVDFGWTTERVLRRIRALSPTPGLALEVKGVELFVTRAEPAPSYVSALLPGEAHVAESLSLRTSDGAVRVTGAYFPDIEANVDEPSLIAASLSVRGAP